jgi:hypothetical protein
MSQYFSVLCRINEEIQLQSSQMEKKALEAARIEFDRAHLSVDELQNSTTYPDVQRHWVAFLAASGKIFTKLERGSKTRPKSVAWFSKIKEQRQTDPILSYIWNARNKDMHGIEEVTHLHPGKIDVVNPTPEESVAFEKKMRAFGKPYVGLAMLEIIYPHVRLADIRNREGFFPAPKQQNGNLIMPAGVGLLALSIVDKMIGEASLLDA